MYLNPPILVLASNTHQHLGGHISQHENPASSKMYVLQQILATPKFALCTTHQFFSYTGKTPKENSSSIPPTRERNRKQRNLYTQDPSSNPTRSKFHVQIQIQNKAFKSKPVQLNPLK